MERDRWGGAQAVGGTWIGDKEKEMIRENNSLDALEGILVKNMGEHRKSLEAIDYQLTAWRDVQHTLTTLAEAANADPAQRERLASLEGYIQDNIKTRQRETKLNRTRIAVIELFLTKVKQEKNLYQVQLAEEANRTPVSASLVESARPANMGGPDIEEVVIHRRQREYAAS
jgi:hypothetical protein